MVLVDTLCCTERTWQSSSARCWFCLHQMQRLCAVFWRGCVVSCVQLFVCLFVYEQNYVERAQLILQNIVALWITARGGII